MKQEIELRVNGQNYEMEIEPWRTLLEVLRGHVGLSGTKQSCNEGHCGACTVIVDGLAVNSCLMLAVEAQGRHVVRSTSASPIRATRFSSREIARMAPVVEVPEETRVAAVAAVQRMLEL